MKRIYLTKPIKDNLVSNLTFKIITKLGWKYQEPPKLEESCVYVAYPHTSNWDTILGLCAGIIWNHKIFVLVKEDYDRPILREIMNFFNMLPIQRSSGALSDTQNYYKKTKASIVVAVEGTRKLSKGWKKGFHWLAKENNLPIILGHYNYKEKIFGWDAIMFACESPEQTIQKCKEVYLETNPVGKYPELASPIKGISFRDK